MEARTQKQIALKRTLLVMLLAGATVTGAAIVPALQGHGVQVAYAACEAGVPHPDLDCPDDPTPTPTATPDPNH